MIVGLHEINSLEKHGMSKIQKTIQSIIEEIDSVNNDPMKPMVDLPSMISTDSGKPLFLNQSIDKKIIEVADHYLDQQNEMKTRYTINEWRSEIRRKVGRCYEATDSNESIEQRGYIFKREIESAKNESISRQNTFLLSFGCSLFLKPLESGFTIGPVTFSTLNYWLDYALENGLIEEAEHKHFMNVLLGSESTIDKEAREQLKNLMVFDVIRDAHMMCTVKTEGLAYELARKRSLIAARLAQTSIALLWRRPSRILENMCVAGEHSKFMRHMFISTPNASLTPRSEWVGASSIICEDITKIESYDEQLFDLFGQMITCWTSNTQYSQASELLRGLSQALYFFWSGCNDDELMSIVKFSASLEALSPKQKSSAVLGLLKSRLNLNEDEFVTKNETLKQIVDLVYSKARSRTLHGTNAKLLHDWSIVQAYAEELTRDCILSSMKFLVKNPTATKLKCLSS